jgi:hypothetical protein
MSADNEKRPPRQRATVSNPVRKDSPKYTPPGTPVVGISEEVITHHSRQHIAECGEHPSFVIPCPCHTTFAICCLGCRQPVFAAVKQGAWCQHADELREVMR